MSSFSLGRLFLLSYMQFILLDLSCLLSSFRYEMISPRKQWPHGKVGTYAKRLAKKYPTPNSFASKEEPFKNLSSLFCCPALVISLFMKRFSFDGFSFEAMQSQAGSAREQHKLAYCFPQLYKIQVLGQLSGTNMFDIEVTDHALICFFFTRRQVSVELT